MEIEADRSPDYDLQPREVQDQLGSVYSGFVRKVFSLIGTQVLLTACVVALAKGFDSVGNALLENAWLLVPTMIVFIVTACMPICCKQLGRRVPLNYIILFTFVTCTLDPMRLHPSGLRLSERPHQSGSGRRTPHCPGNGWSGDECCSGKSYLVRCRLPHIFLSTSDDLHVRPRLDGPFSMSPRWHLAANWLVRLWISTLRSLHSN